MCRVCCRLGRASGTQREVLDRLSIRQGLLAHGMLREATAVTLQCAARGLLASKLLASPCALMLAELAAVQRDCASYVMRVDWRSPDAELLTLNPYGAHTFQEKR